MTSRPMEDVSSEVEQIISALKVAPEGSESSYFLQKILNFVWTGIYIEREDVSGDMYENVVNSMAKTPHFFEIHEDKLKSLKTFIESFLARAYDSDILFEDAFWLEETTIFFVELQKHPSVSWVASLLATIFIASFYKIYLILRDVNEINQPNENLASFSYMWLDYMTFIQHAIRSKKRNIYFTNEVINVLRIMSQCDIIFHNKEFHFDFYLECLLSQNYLIINSALKSLKCLAENGSISDSESESVLEFMLNDRCATVLYVLATDQSVRIVEKTLQLLLWLNRLNRKISCWNSKQYCTVFLNMFKESEKLRKLSGDFMISSFGNESDIRKLAMILDFYVQYMDDPGQMNLLVDALWSYDYIKDLKQLIQLFRKPNEYDKTILISNAVLAHFCVALLNRLLKSEFDEANKILPFIKYTPQVLRILRDSDVYHIWLGIFFAPNMVKLCHDLSASEPRYLKALFKELGFGLSTSKSYYLANDIGSIFMNFMEIGNNEANQVMKDIAEYNFNTFVTINSEDLTLEELNREDSDLNLVLSRLIIILDFESLLSDEQNNVVYDLTDDGIFIKKLFSNVDNRDSTTVSEIFYAATFAKTLVRKFIKAFKLNEFEPGHLEELKNKVLSLMVNLKKILKRKDASFMIKELAIGTTVSMITIMQPNFSLNALEEIRMLAMPPDKEIFQLVMESSTSFLCCEIERSKNHTQLILKHLKLFYKLYSGFPASVVDWKYLSQLLLNCPLIDGVNDVLLAIAQHSTPFERKYKRIGSLLAAILIKWGDEKTDAKAVINRLTSLFKIHFEDWPVLFTSITFQTIDKLHQRIGAIPPDRNRMLSLNLLKHFVNAAAPVDEICRTFNQFSRELRKDELQTWKNFLLFLIEG